MKTTTITDLIAACEFSYINENIPKLFPVEPSDAEIEVRNFGKSMTSEEVLAVFKSEGLRPATATELFQWISAHKDFGEDAWRYVVALGSVVEFGGERRVCDAHWDGAMREADLSWFGKGWRDDAFFAFSREPFAPLALPSDSLPLELTINGVTYKRV